MLPAMPVTMQDIAKGLRKVRTRKILIIPWMVVRQSSERSGARLSFEAASGRYESKQRPAGGT
jgi:hypothetical protein